MLLPNNIAFLASAAALTAWVCTAPAAQEVADKPEAVAVYAEAVAALRQQDCPRATELLRRYLELAPATLARNPTLLDKIDHQIAICQNAEEPRCEHTVLRGERTICLD
jgi:hypothetical protein